MTNIKSIVEAWEIDEPKYRNLGQTVSIFIKDNISEHEFLPEIQWRTKELVSIIKKLNIKTYSYNDIKDKLGVRIICDFQNELEIIDEFINKNFIVKKVEKKKEELDVKTLDYVSNHYDVMINGSINGFHHIKDYSDFIFEIQVRTLNQHAWSNAAHRLAYKQEKDLDPSLLRRIYRLLSLYEIADDEFTSVYNKLRSDDREDSLLLLDKIEGKFFKFAKMEYDKDYSIESIKNLIGFISDEDDIKKMISEIINFIDSNEKKIRQIYTESKDRLYEVLVLTQPEIFLTWYMLEKHRYTLEDNWSSCFDRDDLEMTKTLWGNKL